MGPASDDARELWGQWNRARAEVCEVGSDEDVRAAEICLGMIDSCARQRVADIGRRRSARRCCSRGAVASRALGDAVPSS
jgi:hypothetical protein